MNALQRGKNQRFYGYQSRCSTTELQQTCGSYGYAIILGSYENKFTILLGVDCWSVAYSYITDNKWGGGFYFQLQEQMMFDS